MMKVRFIFLCLFFVSCSKRSIDVFYVAYRVPNNNIKKLFKLSLDENNMNRLQDIVDDAQRYEDTRDFVELIIGDKSVDSGYILIGENFSGDVRNRIFFNINKNPPFSIDYIFVKWKGNIFNRYPCVEKKYFFIEDFLSREEKSEMQKFSPLKKSGKRISLTTA